MPRKPIPSTPAPSAARTTSPPPDTDQARAVALSVRIVHIEASPSNPRKNFDETKLAELAASIKSKGVLQPILVRPTYRNRKSNSRDLMRPEVFWAEPHNWPSMTFELVAGERRYRAANLAGLTEIPAIVRDLTDLQVLEIQIIENEQRTDVSPLEKADGYAALVEGHGVPVEDIAARVGKSPATIYGLLKLRKLSPKARAAVDAGTLPVSSALLIARIPDETKRNEMLDFATDDDQWDGLPSYRRLKEAIEQECMVQLKGCSFDRDDPNLVPSAGACTACPHLAGNRPDEYPDTRADLCMLPSCFRAKVEAHTAALIAKAREKGRAVLEGQAAERALQGWSSDYHALSDKCFELNKTYKQLVGHAMKERITVAIDRQGKAHELVAKKEASPLLKELGLKPQQRVDSSYSHEERRRKAEGKIRTQVADLAAAAIAAKVEQGFSSAVGLDAGHARLVRVLVLQTVGKVQHEHRRRVMKRHDLDSNYFDTDDFAKLIEAMNARQLLGFWAELVTTSDLHGGFHESEDAAKKRSVMCAALGVDYAALDQQVRGEAKDKKARKSTKVKGKR